MLMVFKLGLVYKWLGGVMVKIRAILIFPDGTWRGGGLYYIWIVSLIYGLSSCFQTSFLAKKSLFTKIISRNLNVKQKKRKTKSSKQTSG